MAQQPTEKDDSKVALDMADLPLPEIEEEPPPPPKPQYTVDATGFDPGSLAPDEPGKRRLPKLVLIAAAALLALILLGLVWFLFLRDSGDKAPEPEPTPVHVRPVGPPRATLEPFIIPVKPDPRGRLLKLLVMLEFDSSEAMDTALTQNTPLIREVLYLSLRDNSLEDINSARMNNILGTQLKDRLNKALGANMIKHVYFPDFLFAG